MINIKFKKLLASITILFLGVIQIYADSPKKIVSSLPKLLKNEYKGIAVKKTPLDNYKAPKAPWKWCHSESYLGNSWRVTVKNELTRMVEDYKKRELISSFELSDSNGDVGLQNSHIRSFILKKCDIITSIPSSSTGINSAIKKANKAGIPFLTAAGGVTSPYAINIDSNYEVWGFNIANRLAKKLDGKGNILMVEGIAGNPITASQRAGALRAFKKYPNIKVVRKVNGNWTPSVTKTAIIQTLASNPRTINGVWTTGSEVRIVLETFKQSGKKIPVVTGSITSDALAFWKKYPNDFKFTGGFIGPHWVAETLFRVGARILSGQKIKFNTLLIPIPVVTMDNLNDYYASCMKIKTVAFPIPKVDPFPVKYMNNYFDKAEAAPYYRYGDVPQFDCSK